MRFSRLAAMAGASVLVVGIASCSATGGKPEEIGRGMGRQDRDTPRMTVAMITHEVPGDSFWDLIRKGAEAAAEEGQHRAALLERSGGAEPGQPGSERHRQRGQRHRRHAGQAGCDGAGGQGRLERKGIPVVAFNSGFDNFKAMGITGVLRPRREASPGSAAGERLNKDGAKKVICVIQEQGQVALESRCAGVKEGFQGQTEILNVNSKDMPSVESTITAKLQQDPSVDSRRRAGRADCVDRGAVGQAMPVAPRRSSPSIPMPRWSTRSRAATCSGRSTSSRSCRAIWRSTHCGCTSTTRT